MNCTAVTQPYLLNACFLSYLAYCLAVRSTQMTLTASASVSLLRTGQLPSPMKLSLDSFDGSGESTAPVLTSKNELRAVEAINKVSYTAISRMVIKTDGVRKLKCCYHHAVLVKPWTVAFEKLRGTCVCVCGGGGVGTASRYQSDQKQSHPLYKTLECEHSYSLRTVSVSF